MRPQINEQVGLRSKELYEVENHFTIWCKRHLMSIRATHLLGVNNRGADLLSRVCLSHIRPDRPHSRESEVSGFVATPGSPGIGVIGGLR